MKFLWTLGEKNEHELKRILWTPISILIIEKAVSRVGSRSLSLLPLLQSLRFHRSTSVSAGSDGWRAHVLVDFLYRD